MFFSFRVSLELSWLSVSIVRYECSNVSLTSFLAVLIQLSSQFAFLK